MHVEGGRRTPTFEEHYGAGGAGTLPTAVSAAAPAGLVGSDESHDHPGTRSFFVLLVAL